MAEAPRRRYESPLRDEQAQATRERILDALVRTMSRGVAALSIPAVAREAGVSVPTVYRHFGNKEDLVKALADHIARKRGFADTPSPRSPDELAAHVAEAYPMVDAEDEALRAAIASELGQEVRREWYRDRFAMVDDALAAVAHRIDPDDYQRLRNVLTLLCTSHTLRFMRDQLQLTADEAAESAGWAIRTLADAATKEQKQP